MRCRRPANLFNFWCPNMKQSTTTQGVEQSRLERRCRRMTGGHCHVIHSHESDFHILQYHSQDDM